MPGKTLTHEGRNVQNLPVYEILDKTEQNQSAITLQKFGVPSLSMDILCGCCAACVVFIFVCMYFSSSFFFM